MLLPWFLEATCIEGTGYIRVKVRIIYFHVVQYTIVYTHDQREKKRQTSMALYRA